MYYSYSAAQWLLVFYLYCMLGWCFESSVVSVGQRRLVNRGFLRGPMLPIYGFGAVILLHVSLPLKQHPVWLYLASMIAATVFEYIVGVVMEKIFKVKYWDYSKQRFQFQGYICLRSSLCWGFLGLILTSVIHPPIEKLVLGLPFIGLIVIDVLFSAAFISDVIVSVRSALDLAKVLEELDRLREQRGEERSQHGGNSSHANRQCNVALGQISHHVRRGAAGAGAHKDDTDGQLSGQMEHLRQRPCKEGHQRELCNAADNHVLRAAEHHLEILRLQGEAHAEHNDAQQGVDPCGLYHAECAGEEQGQRCHHNDDGSHILAYKIAYFFQCFHVKLSFSRS